MFADDVKMYLKIINDVDIVYLQAALTSLVEWANEWQLAISIEKCCLEHWQASACSSHTPGQLSTTCCSTSTRPRCIS